MDQRSRLCRVYMGTLFPRSLLVTRSLCLVWADMLKCFGPVIGRVPLIVH